MTKMLPGALRLEGVGKCYKNYRRPHDWLLEKLGARPVAAEAWALKDLSFELRPGEALGVVGHNGAGKSTLLQIIAGTLEPTQGQVSRGGRIAALLELGAGFNPEFSGYENARLNALLMGLTRAEIDERMPEIIDFSGIGEAIDRPVKTYSSGMFVRLAFAVATSVEPDILIIDEALSVGDGSFARKSFDRIMEIRERGATLLFCSHALYQIEKLCDRSVWIEKGQLVMDGPSRQVVNAYQAKMDREALGLTGAGETTDGRRRETGAVPRLIGIQVCLDGEPVETRQLECLSQQSDLLLKIQVSVPQGVPLPNVVVSITHASGQRVFGTGNWLGATAQPLHALGGDRYAIELLFPRLALLAGNYRVDLAVTCESGVHFYDSASGALLLNVMQADETQGVVALAHAWAEPAKDAYEP